MVAEPQITFLPDPVVPSRGAFVLYAVEADAVGKLPAAAERLGLTGLTRRVPLVLPGPDGPEVRDVEALEVDVAAGVRALLGVRAVHGSWFGHADGLRIWALAAHAVWRLVVGHHVVPSLTLDGEGVVHGVWRALPAADPEVEALLDRLAAAMPPAAHPVPRDDTTVWAPGELLTAFADAVADVAVRAATEQPRSGRPRARVLPWTARWEEALRDQEDSAVPVREGAADLVAGVAEWHRALGADDRDGLTEVALSAPDAADGPWVLDLGVRTDTGTLLRASEVWSPADEEDRARQETLLAGLGRCARVFPPLEAALSEAVPESVELDAEQAWEFISEATPLIEAAGIIVRLPEDLDEGALRIRLRVGTDVEADDEEAEGVEEVGFQWEVALGDETLSDDELADLYAARQPLVRWRGRWVRIDPEEAERMRDLAGPGTLSLSEALGLALAGTQPAGWDGPTASDVEAEVVADGHVAQLIERLRDAADLPAVSASPEGFSGELRPYQQRGVAWLQGMGTVGFGGVLADDMGLGKTIQLIGYLLRRETDRPHLVVCPTSVVGNWEREVRRFAPDLPVTRHHGPERAATIEDPVGVYLTTYGTLRRDADVLAAVEWDVVALDEAQHVKNPSTAAARAARRLPAVHRLALTGTPLENRLAELWSLLDFTNPGLLGTRGRFGRRFVNPIEKRRDPVTAARLRRLVAPFILRREKTDPSVISDLPEKIERTVVCPLTPEQADRYRAAVDEVLGEGALAASSRMERRGRILALLTRLKQICNHPAQGSDEPEPQLAGRSGKLAACREIIAEATDAGDQVLVFTQYVGMGRLLVRQLSADLGMDVPMLHGGVAATQRDRMVARFQGEADDHAPPVLVVSLRAGGTGLNLTAATHVVHYDRWWNPAVEDQATDRAHRIGQRRTVEVHKLVTSGTVEERIADLLESKRALAASVVGAGEAWITELGDDELSELFALAGDADIEELDDDPWTTDALEEAS
jgi:hypothetical protein